jgi:hypothetical protein
LNGIRKLKRNVTSKTLIHLDFSERDAKSSPNIFGIHIGGRSKLESCQKVWRVLWRFLWRVLWRVLWRFF